MRGCGNVDKLLKNDLFGTRSKNTPVNSRTHKVQPIVCIVSARCRYEENLSTWCIYIRTSFIVIDLAQLEVDRVEAQLACFTCVGEQN